MSCANHAAIARVPRSIVSVNGTLIPDDAISQEAQNHPATTPIGAWTAAARALVMRELLLQRAKALGLAAEPQVDSQGRRETNEEAQLRAVIDHDVRLPRADEVTSRRYYQRNKDRFRSVEILEASHILIAARPQDDAAYQAAAQRAIDLHAAITDGRAAFSVVARLHSECPSRLNGGSLGQVTEGDTVPEFEDALRTLAPGQLCSAPVASRYGFHIVRLDRRIECRTVPFDVVKGRIAAYLDDRVRQHALAQYARILIDGADVHGIEPPAAAGRGVAMAAAHA
jgi:peptidyl-prolyl cis-trans isomerase C